MSANPLDAVPATVVSEQLARIVNNPKFISSPRLCRFLTHIVNRTIHGDLDSLKEFSIAVEVFDRTSEYDPNIDAIVRVEARRLRAKLKEYYEGLGRNDAVLIGLRPGSYVPIFRWLDPQLQNETQEIGTTIRTGAASVAVLPFVNMSPDPEQDYFCDGITEEIANLLTHVPGLKVIARSSAFQFRGMSVDVREVGPRLGADLVIEGSVRKAGSRLRITAQANETESGHYVWSETFARKIKHTMQRKSCESLHTLSTKDCHRGVVSSVCLMAEKHASIGWFGAVTSRNPSVSCRPRAAGVPGAPTAAGSMWRAAR